MMEDRCADRTKATAAGRHGVDGGLLRPEEFARFVHHLRHPVGDAASRWVENHWSCGGTCHRSVVRQPGPAAPHLLAHRRAGRPPALRACRRAAVVVTGVFTRRFDVEVRGWGRVVGVRFRPGGLAALTGRPASAWTDRSVRGRRGAAGRAWWRRWPTRARGTGATGPGGGSGPGRARRRAPRPAHEQLLASSPRCSPTAPCSRWPRSPSGTASRSGACSGCSRTTSGSARSGCSRATGCTTPWPTSTPAGTAPSPTSPCATAGTTRRTSPVTSAPWSVSRRGSTATGRRREAESAASAPR